MNLKELKSKMLLPEKEIFLNKEVTIRGEEYILVSITSQNGKNCLWVLKYVPNHFEQDEEIAFEGLKEENNNYYCTEPKITIREDLLDKINNSKVDTVLKELTIQGQTMSFSGSSGERICDSSYDIYMRMQHFVENGLINTSFDRHQLFDVMLYCYEQAENEKFPVVDTSKDLNISVKINKSFKQEIINQPLSLKIKKYDRGHEYSFYSEYSQKQYKYYVDDVQNYDIWEDTKDYFDTPKMKEIIEKNHISDKQIEQMKNDYYEATKQICPKDKNLVMIEYETDGDIQLQFYTKEFLDTEVEYSQSAKSYLMMFRPENPVGKNGYANKICMLQPIDKSFDGVLDIELFSCFIDIPEETVEIK